MLQVAFEVCLCARYFFSHVGSSLFLQLFWPQVLYVPRSLLTCLGQTEPLNIAALGVNQNLSLAMNSLAVFYKEQNHNTKHLGLYYLGSGNDLNFMASGS